MFDSPACRLYQTYNQDNGNVGVIQLPLILAETEDDHDLSTDGDSSQNGERSDNEPIIPPENTAHPA